MKLLLVRTGTKYGREYVTRLAAGVRQFLAVDEILLFTDTPSERFDGIRIVDISALALPGWWGKMALFDPALRGSGPSLFFDLDTIVLGDLSTFHAIAKTYDFTTCASFARQYGNKAWPCSYGSCIMTFRDGWGVDIWNAFQRRREELLPLLSQQRALETLYPHAALLQEILGKSYFLNYRDLPDYRERPPDSARLLIFGGKNKPHNVKPRWAKRAWREAARCEKDRRRFGSSFAMT